jgi:hypothetical protein
VVSCVPPVAEVNQPRNLKPDLVGVGKPVTLPAPVVQITAVLPWPVYTFTSTSYSPLSTVTVPPCGLRVIILLSPSAHSAYSVTTSLVKV